MTTADGSAFLAIYTRVCKLWDRPVKEDVAVEFFDALKELPLAIVDEAGRAVCKTSRFFPKPVDWLDAAYKLDRPKPGFAKERWAVMASGERVATYVCLKCNDGGFRWECGCLFEDVDGKCQTHGTGSSASRMPVTQCECRSTNPEWLSRNRTKREFQEVR